MNETRIRRALGAAAVLVALAAAPALATNGMYLAGYGSEAAGRGGANLAIADRALGLQANPAGIAQLQGNHLSFDLQGLLPDLRFAGDPFGNQVEGKDRLFTMPSVSFVRGGKDTPWTWGLGLISQGGMGATFQNVATPFGTKDETFSEVRFLTLTPTVAFAVSRDVALGLSANVGYSDVQFRFWPYTSFYSDGGTPADPGDDMGFFGASLVDRARAFNYSVRAGAMWTVNEQVQIGAVFQTRTQGDYENGKLRMNMSAIGLGGVNYDATVDGFTWPGQVGLGVQVRPAERWLFAFDTRYYLWHDAMERITVKGTNPSNPSAPYAEIRMPFTFLWDDQWAYALGGEYRASDALTVRGGWNYGRSPVPDATLNPLFPATTQQHAAAGLGYTWRGNTVNLAVERAFEASQVNGNLDPNVNPFGPGAGVDHSQWTVSLGFSKAFSR
jgi:long-chain fatty acid transport protein